MKKSVKKELEYLEKVQDRCVRFSKYLEFYDGRYDDLIAKLACVVGSIEEVLNFDEQ